MPLFDIFQHLFRYSFPLPDGLRGKVYFSMLGIQVMSGPFFWNLRQSKASKRIKLMEAQRTSQHSTAMIKLCTAVFIAWNKTFIEVQYTNYFQVVLKKYVFLRLFSVPIVWIWKTHCSLAQSLAFNCERVSWLPTVIFATPDFHVDCFSPPNLGLNPQT